MMYVMKGNPESAQVDLPHLILAQTYQCNYNCGGCNVQNGQQSKHLAQTGVKKLINRWADYVSRNGGKGIFHAKGGEPLLFEGFFENLHYAADRGLYVFMTTNASLFTNKEYQELEKIYQKTRGQVIVSLDGSTNEVNNLSRQENSYDAVIKTITEFKRRGIPFAINDKIHQGNQDDLEKAISLAKKLGAEQFNVLPHTKIKTAVNKSNEIPALNVLLPQLEGAMNNGAENMLEWCIADMIKKQGSGEYRVRGCPVGYKGLIYITPNGDTFSCPNTVIEEYKLGTIGDSFEKLFDSEIAEELRKMHNGRLSCKGELIAYETQPENMEKLKKSEELIKNRTNKVKTRSTGRKQVAVCFNRNY